MRVPVDEVGLLRGDSLLSGYSVCVKETPHVTRCAPHRQLLCICIILKVMESSCSFDLHVETKEKLVLLEYCNTEGD
jgi:hypothetical protein